MLKTIHNILVTLAWHHWRIATLRPAYARLSDSPVTLIGFAVCLAAALVLRVVLAWNSGVTAQALISLFGSCFLLVVSLYAGARIYSCSLSFAAGMTGALTVSTLLVCVQTQLELDSAGAELTVVSAALFVCLWTLGQFLQQPAEVRQRGYRASRGQRDRPIT